MRFAIFGDIHANLEALQAVLQDAKDQGCTHYVCLGDIVGYNANPQECVDLIRELGCPVVKGNHDEQACLDTSLEGFNPLAEEALTWTRKQLSGESIAWLAGLRFVRMVHSFTVVHATLDTPEKWGYIFTPLEAAASFSYQHTAVCFCGHTHCPGVFVRDDSVVKLPFTEVKFEMGKKYLINVGSVGQPRDGDWRASYAVYDTHKNCAELRRLEYDRDTATRKILDAGLPRRLAERLIQGK